MVNDVHPSLGVVTVELVKAKVPLVRDVVILDHAVLKLIHHVQSHGDGGRSGLELSWGQG